MPGSCLECYVTNASATMYHTGLSYWRQRSIYDDYDRLGYSLNQNQAASSGGASSSTTATNSRPSDTTTTPTAARRTRYVRSSTTASVTQMLSDSCKNLLQNLTTRVRPSATAERQLPTSSLSTTRNKTPVSSSTRSRLEDKYSAVLDKIYGKKQPGTSSSTSVSTPSVGHALSKSATTSQIHTEKSLREKTPYLPSSSKYEYPEPQYSYFYRDAIYRVRNKSTTNTQNQNQHHANHLALSGTNVNTTAGSGFVEPRPRRSSRPHRSNASETRYSSNTRLCPVEIDLDDDEDVSYIGRYQTPTNHYNNNSNNNGVTSLAVTEREKKRKEIQSLIMKYSALDEAYNRMAVTNASSESSIPNKVKNCSSNVKPAIVPIQPAPMLSRDQTLVANGKPSLSQGRGVGGGGVAQPLHCVQQEQPRKYQYQYHNKSLATAVSMVFDHLEIMTLAPCFF